jgi:ATP-dependent exoDNAse (exonuclease V) beta subunit
LTYIEQRKGTDNAFSQYGSFVHELLEDYANNKKAVFELLDAFVDGYPFSVTKEFPPNAHVDLNESYYNDGVAYFTEFDGFGDYEVVAAEDEFEEAIDDDFILNGFIDLVLKDKDGNIIIRDHKSKSSFKNKKEQHDYARQLYLYRLRIYRKYGQYPKLLQFNMFRKQNLIDIPFNQKDYDEALLWMKNTVKQIRECKEYPAKADEFFCKFLCNHGKTCEFGRCTED